jgi:pimeloyl-ACP methyl ester carboxylesterase
MKFEDHFFRTSDGAIIYFEDYNKECDDVIVLIPGFCCTTLFFKNNIPELSKNHRVITFDPRGQGKSSKGLAGHTIERNCQDIAELLAYLNATDVTMLGWSMAGQFIVKYFDMYGKYRIKALGLIDCPLGAAYDEEWNAHGLKGFNITKFNQKMNISTVDNKAYCTKFSHMMYDGIDESKIEWATNEMIQTPTWISFAIYYDLVMQNGFELLKNIDVPMVFFGANGNVTANGKELAEKWYPLYAENVPYYESYGFDHGGHVFFDVYPEEFNKKLLHFVDKVNENKNSKKRVL